MRLITTLLLLLSSLPLCSQTAPAIRRITDVESVSLTNDSIVSSEDFQQMVQTIQSRRYGPNQEKWIVDAARSVLGDKGYFEADVQIAGTQVLNESTRARAIAVTLRIREGEQYRVSRIIFVKNKVFPEAQLRPLIPINDGDVMSDKKIREGLENMGHLYSSKGYMEMTPVPEIVADETSRTLSITMDVDEGPQFTINGLTLDESPRMAVNGVASKGHEWPEDKAAKLQALSQSFRGSHDVEGFVDQVKRLLAELFPGYDQIDSLVGTTQGTEKHIVTVNVVYPSDLR